MSRALAAVLTQIRSKVESRTTRPWFDLQRGYYFRDVNGVKDLSELRKALDHFHCSLGESDLRLLWSAFPLTRPDGTETFDFKAFARTLYPDIGSSGFEVIRGGRTQGTLPAAYTRTSTSSAGAAIATAADPLAWSSGPAAAGGTSSARGLSSQYPQAAMMASFSASAPLQSAPPSFGQGADAKSHELPIADSYDSTTAYLEEYKRASAAGVVTERRRTRPAGRSRSLSTSGRVAPAAHNRPPHLRYHDPGVQTLLYKKPVPSAQAYPEHEFKGHGQFRSLNQKPRFNIRPLPTGKGREDRIF